ncbi:MAG: hypothetical protein J0M12_03075 [Deltaproteobacteria bacterium]|nr:hypothetical protein [Deltaproteobacteria bacterium]
MNSDALAGYLGSEKQLNRPDLGHALRHDLYAKVEAILSNSDQISDSNTRLLIQASCLDVISTLEDVIQRFGLDRTLQ